jgi:GH3 auxin-responsive promoter
VTTVIDELFASLPPPHFAMLTPEPTSNGIAYTLLVEPEGRLPAGFEARLEQSLRRNPHYAWCVDLGQLRPARVVSVGPGADRTYLEACAARGQRLGNVKPAALRIESGWEHALRGVD